MGRRSLGSLSPAQAREAVGRHFRRLTSTSGVNLAQFTAQLHEENMVEMLAGFAYDVGQAPAFRRECAKDVLLFARGAIKSWSHDGETVDPAGPGVTTETRGEEIGSAIVAADVFRRLTDLTARRVPPEMWPDDVKAAVGDAVEAFASDVVDVEG